MSAAQDAIDSLAARQSVNNSIDPNFHAATLQAIYNDLVNLTINTSNTEIVLIPSPALNTILDTGLDISALNPNDFLAVGVLYLRSGINYGSKDTTQIQALLDVPDLRQIKVSEDLDSNSQVKHAYWWDDTSMTLKARIAVEGPGVTVLGLRVVQYHNFLALPL